MKLFLYYAAHSVKNQIKKLLKSKVLIFILICFVMGALIGIGAGKLAELSEEREDPGQVEIIEDDPLSGEDVIDVEINVDAQTVSGVVELIAGAVILLVFVMSILGADKNGSKIFLPADVALLFPAPMRPQSVLLFRLATQLGMILVASVYILFQIPNLMMNMGLSIWACLALGAAWILTVAMSKLVQVLLYTVCSTHAGLKPYLRRAVYGVLFLIVGAYVLFWRQSGLGQLEAAAALYASTASRWIPVWGWLKGIAMFAVEGNWWSAALCAALTLISGAALLVVIPRVHADFYEDAMAKSEETAELIERAKASESGGVIFARRKKNRAESLRREGMNRGFGANVYFHKALYNRFRFAHLGIFTKTAETYLAAGAGMALLCRLVFQTRTLIPVALLLAVYRTLGNPLEEDTRLDYFVLIPESTWSKLLWSLLGGSANCVLDVLPAMLAAVLILRGDPLSALAWTALVVSVDLYATGVGTFINLSTPVNAGKTVKQLIQVLFLYFGILPDAAIMALGLILGAPAAAAAIAAAANVGLGLLFFGLTTLFLPPNGGR